jgi:hypothetical protein
MLAPYDTTPHACCFPAQVFEIAIRSADPCLQKVDILETSPQVLCLVMIISNGNH